MERSSEEKSPKEHITAIFKDYEASARVLQTLTNLSNTVIETALSGQCKFLFEILQNADDAFDDQSKHCDIKLQLVLSDDYFIIQHNGKVFNYYDVERICDYASQIEEVKANDLSKTGYKGLGFKSLFNLSDCIYIYSNGYSFRFDKKFWPDPEKKPWQVIPIWCDSLPLSERYTYDEPVNFIMKINDKKQLIIQLKELIDHPEVLLYLHRVNSVYLDINGTKVMIERKVEKFGIFHKIVFLKNQHIVTTWLSRIYEQAISPQLKKCIREVSQFIYPEKIKNAEKADFTFTVCTNQKVEDVSKVDGLCYSTLPTQLKLSLPYHVNSHFILNLDRTQFHENEWNEFLVYQVGYFQLSFLKDIAELPNLKNFVIDLLVRQINHSYSVFNRAFSKGFTEAKIQIAWLPAYKGHLLKLGEACVDKIYFFKQNFENVQDRQCGCVIDPDVKSQDLLSKNEAVCFDYDTLCQRFLQNYYPQLTESSYKRFLSYIYEISQKIPLGSSRYNLENTQFLKTKNGILISPREALLEEEKTLIPDFAALNPIDNKYFPENNRDSFKNWLVNLGAKQLNTPIQILRESVFQWINSGNLLHKMKIYHKAIISYLAKNFRQLTFEESQILKKKLFILTKSSKFAIITSCYLPNAITLEELGDVMSDDEVISPCYDIFSLKDFFSHLGISDKLNSIEVFRKCILMWIKENKIKSKFTIENYKPIIEFLSSEYQKIQYDLRKEEKEQLGKLPILTYTQTFQQANDCYFDTAIPDVKGFEDIIEKNILVSIQNFSDVVLEFLSYIGVKKVIHPKDVIRGSILKWIQNRIVHSRINSSNHYDIVKYIAEHWHYLNELEPREKEALKKLPVLTKNNSFREVCTCFWQTTSGTAGSKNEIPKLDLIVSADELVSSKYFEIPELELSSASADELKDYASKKEECSKIKSLLNKLGVHYLKFDEIYDRYCNLLTEFKSAEWFFSNLVEYWESNRWRINNDKLLNDLKAKLKSSCLLSKNGKLYPVTNLYSSHFLNIHSIDENAVPVLVFEHLPKELEKWLGIKQEIELSCIMELLAAIDKKQNLGKEDTLIFFKFLLEQLLLKDKNEIKKYSLKLLSNVNKLTFAKELYYFEEEYVVCYADSYYLKRIHGMSHDDTLALAKLCEVNVLPFNYEVNYGEQAPTCDKTLREFYLKKLPLIVFQESKEINESSHIVLKNLFLKVNSFDLHKCQNILIKYPFGKPVKRRYHFDYPKIYVAGNWTKVKTKIHEYIKKVLELKSDISDILDLESAEDKTEWLEYQEDPQKLLVIEEELNKLLSSQEIDCIETDKYDSVDDGTNSNQISVKLDVATVNEFVDSESADLLFEQDFDSTQVESVTINESVASVGKGIRSYDSLKQDIGFEKVKEAPTDNQAVDSESKRGSNSEEDFVSNEDLLLHHSVSFGKVKNDTVNQSVDSGNDSISSDNLLIKQDVDFEEVNAISINQHADGFEEVNAISINQHADLKNGQDSMSSLKNVNSGLEKLTYDNTLREFYFERLPVIVRWESKKQKLTPTEVLENLHNKISSIELYQCSDIRIQYSNTHIVETNCFFDGLKIYVVGKWSSQKLKIHQYIKEKLGLNTDVTVINIEPISQIVEKETILHQIEEIETLVPAEETLTNEPKFTNDKDYPKDTEQLENIGKENTCFKKDKPQKLHNTEQAEKIGLKKDELQKLHKIKQDIKALESTEEINELQFTSDKEYPKHTELSEDKKNIAGAFSDGNSEYNSGYRSFVSRPNYSIKFKGTKVLIMFAERTEIVEQYNSTSDHLDEDAVKINVKLTPRKQSTYYKNRAQKPHTFKSYSLPVNLVEPDILLQDNTEDEFRLKRLGEKYVFIFLQDYYKTKYPDAQISSERACFTLLWQSHTTEIIWLNDDEDKGLEYDLLLKKNEEVKQYIAVKSVNQAKSDLFNKMHSIFARRNKFATEHPEYNAKYCIYCILYEDDSSPSFPEEMTNVNALYKIVSLKLPSV